MAGQGYQHARRVDELQALVRNSSDLLPNPGGGCRGFRLYSLMFKLKVPNVNERKRIPKRAIRAVVKHIAEQFKPDKVILFGSYAYGYPKPGSDVDLLVVMDTPEGEWPLMQAIWRSLSPHQFGMDILVRSQAEIERRIALGDWFMEEIMTKGKVLYANPDCRVGRKG